MSIDLMAYSPYEMSQSFPQPEKYCTGLLFLSREQLVG